MTAIESQNNASPPAHRHLTGLWPIIVSMAFVRLILSLILLVKHHGFFTLSADDVSRVRIALLWSNAPSFFPDATWPPLPFWLGGASASLFGTGLMSMCLLSVTASLLTFPAIAWLCREWTGDLKQARIATAAACLTFACFPHWIWLGTSMLAGPLYALLFVYALIAFLKARAESSLKWAFIAIALAILSSMTRLEGTALAAILYIMLIWQLRKRLSVSQWATLIGVGLTLVIAFPIAWSLSHTGAQESPLTYFERLKEGFTSQHQHGVLETPLQLLRLYIGFSPLFVFLILAGFFTARRPRISQQHSASSVPFAAVIVLYVIAQCAASSLGMMPTHSFWRLTVPVFVALLPFLGTSFATLSRLISVRALIVPALFCAFYQFHSFPTPPVFVNVDVYESGQNLHEALAEPNAPDGNVLIEVIGWEWLPMALIGMGPDFTGAEFDRNPHFPGAQRMDNVRNPTVFTQPGESFQAFLNSKKITIAAVKSGRAKRHLMNLGWRAVKNGEYIVYTKP